MENFKSLKLPILFNKFFWTMSIFIKPSLMHYSLIFFLLFYLLYFLFYIFALFLNLGLILKTYQKDEKTHILCVTENIFYNLSTKKKLCFNNPI